MISLSTQEIYDFINMGNIFCVRLNCKLIEAHAFVVCHHANAEMEIPISDQRIDNGENSSEHKIINNENF